MLITIDTDSLIKYNLTAEDYTWLLMIADNKQDLLNDYIEKVYKDMSDIQKNEKLELLRVNGLIEPGSNSVITQKAKELLFKDDLFKEFISEFPQKVTRTDGTVDFLRTDLANSEIIYRGYVGRSRDKHNHIMKCLKAEVTQRTSNGSMSYMKRLYTWLSTKSWESYNDIVDEVLTPNKDLGYGTTLI